MDKVAIITVNFNSSKQTISLLKSCFTMDCSNYKYEIFAVDNGSTQNECSTLQNWILNNAKEYPITFIETHENLGFSYANNIILKKILNHPEFNYIFLINNDCLIDSNCIANAIGGLKKYDADIAGLKMYYLNTKKTISEQDNIILSLGGQWDKKLFHIDYVTGRDQTDHFFQDHPIRGYVNGGAFFMRRNVLEKIGLLRDDFFLGIEDVEYSIRAFKNNLSAFFIHNAIVWHEQSGSSGSSNKPENMQSFFRTYYGIRNEIFTVKAHFSKPKQIIYFFLLLPYIIIRSIAGIFYKNKTYKHARIKLILKAIKDGLLDKGGKTIDPWTWMSKYNAN